MGINKNGTKVRGFRTEGSGKAIKKIIYLFSVLMLSLVAGCSDSNETVELYKMENFSDRMEDSKVVYNNEQEVKQFKNAIKSAKQQPGIVDMAEPHFMIEIGAKSYFLWLHENHATIMDTAETHTIYTVTSASVDSLNAMIIVSD